MRLTCVPLAALAVAVCHLFTPRTAMAAGLDVPDLGAASLGKGAADAAAPADLMAIYYNPAGLTQLRGVHVMLNVRLLQDQTTFQRDTSVNNYASVTDAAAILPGPALGVSYGFRLGIPWTVAFGALAPPAFSGSSYPDFFSIRAQNGRGATYDTEAALASPQRYTLIANNTKAFVFSLSLAAQVLPSLSVGAQFQLPLYWFNTTQALYLYNHTGEEAGFDARLSVNAFNGFNNPTGAFGASLKLPANLTAGASFQLPDTIVGHGTMDISPPPTFALSSATITGNSADISIRMPWMLRAGLRYDVPLFSVELDGVYEAWSMYNQTTLTPHDISVSVALTPTDTQVTQVGVTNVKTGMTDAFSVRLGGELHPGALMSRLNLLTIRAGIMYESSAVPLDYTSVNETNWDRVIPTVGVGVLVGAFDLNIAYAHAFQGDRTVTNSQVLQAAGAAPPTVVGNGTYSVIINMLAISAEAHFG